MLLIGTKNIGTQTVLADGLVNIGSTYRKFCKRNRCGVPAFAVTANGVTLNTEGIYHITAVFVGSGSAAGALSVQLALNGVLVDGAISTQTITTLSIFTTTLVKVASIASLVLTKETVCASVEVTPRTQSVSTFA